MIYNENEFRWEVWIGDRLVGWVSDRVPEAARRDWYERLMRRLADQLIAELEERRGAR